MPTYDPFGVNGGGSSTTAPRNYTGGTAKSNAGRVYDPFNIGSVEAAPNPAPQQQPSSAPSAPKQSLFSRLTGVATNVGKAARAVARPVIDVASGQGGKAAHDTAQLASDVSGGTVNQFSRAAVNVPLAVAREIQNKPITDIQNNVFGTTDQGAIAKKIVGSTVGTGSMFVGGGEVAGAKSLLSAGAKALGKRVAIDAAAGAAGNAATTVTTGPNASAKEIGKSAAIGGLFGAVAPVAIKGAGQVVAKAADKIPFGTTADAKNLIQNQRVRSLIETNNKIKEATPPEIKPAIDQGKVDAGLIKPEITTTPRSELAVSANDMHKVDSQKVNQYVKQIKDGEPIEPIITHTVNGQKFVVDGQQRLAAAEKLGVEHVPTVEKVSGADTTPSATSVAKEPTVTEKPVAAPKNIPDAKQQIETIKADTKNYDQAGNLTPDAATQINALNKGTRTPAAEKPVSYTPVTEKPIVTPEIKTSKLAQSVEERAIKKGLTQGFDGLPEYAKMNWDNQAKAASDLFKSDPERVIRIAMGHERPPEGLLPESAYIAIENHAHKTSNADLIRRLATESSLSSEAVGMGQRIGILSQRNPNSAVNGIRQVIEARKTAIEAKLAKSGKTVSNAVDDTVREIKQVKATTMKVTREDWHQFVQSIQCK